jgi:glutathione S-transferase
MRKGLAAVRFQVWSKASTLVQSRTGIGLEWGGEAVAIVLYDLVGRDDIRFSPHCWRTRMALAHKGLEHEARPVRFTEIGRIGDGRVRTVPALEDGGQTIVDSWEIARHLERAYPDRPSLFEGPGGEAAALFIQSWTASTVHAGLIQLILLDIFEHLTPEDRDYFRRTREERFGRRLEKVVAGREARVEDFQRSLQPLRMTLREQPFIGGGHPLYADYLVFGALQWARAVSPLRLLADDDPIRAWFGRCLDLHGGLGRAAPGYD